MPTLHSSSKDSTGQDPVILQTVQAPSLTSSSDAVVKSEIPHPARIVPSHLRSPSGSHSSPLDALHVIDENIQPSPVEDSITATRAGDDFYVTKNPIPNLVGPDRMMSRC